MSAPGETEELLVRSRAALLDALDALEAHREAVIMIGAQAVYLRVPRALVALAEATKDSDLALDPRVLGDDPRIEEAMAAAGFRLDPGSGQPGAWINRDGIPVDLMVPERLAGDAKKGARAARLPPHAKTAMRRALGLEAAVVDHDLMEVTALDASDIRRYHVRVAGSAALLVAKAHKIAERVDSPDRLVDKDAHDIYRILIATETGSLADRFTRLLADDVSAAVTSEALEHLDSLFGAGPDALGAMMAGRAEEGIGEPETVALQASLLAGDLLRAVR